MNKLKITQQAIKESNLKRVFSIINETGSIPRTDIKKITGLSATTVSSLVEVLINDSLVIETGIRPVNTSGRKAILLSANRQGAYFVGVSVLSTFMTINIYDLSLSLVLSKNIKLDQQIILGMQIATNLTALSSSLNILKHIRGIAVGVPAVVDSSGEKILSSTVLNIKDENVSSNIKVAFPYALVVICNNSSLNAYAEKEFGKTGASNIVSIDIDDGVGAGILIDGDIYSGSNGLAGEFGHTSINYMGEKCKCNSQGCLELYLSIPSVLKRASSLLSYDCDSILKLREELDAGNKALTDFVDDLARILSFGINNLNNILDPEAIIISGSISALGDYFLSPLKKYVDEKLLTHPDNVLRVCYSSIKENSVAIGGAKYVFDKLLIK